MDRFPNTLSWSLARYWNAMSAP